MTYRCVKDNFEIYNFDDTRELYLSLGNGHITVDESDLVIFRLMGAQFTYSTIVFEDSSPAVLHVEFDTS